MEHREPSGIVAGEHRLELARRHQPGASRRSLLVLAVLLVVISVAMVLGSRAIRFVAAWLHRQPPYQVPFQSIQLEPEPPPWYRGGRDAFLRGVRAAARQRETLPLLDLKPGQVHFAFLCSPWVERVVHVHLPPHGISVALRYRQPVALVEISSTHRYLLDEHAIILPRDEVNDVDQLVRLGSAIKISGEGLLDPMDRQPGKEWAPSPGAEDLNEGNLRIASAAQLASFLVRKTRSLGSARAPALEIRWIIPTDHQSRGLFLENAEGIPILWGAAPGQEGPKDLTAEDKWALLREWSVRTSARSVPPGDYWEFTKEGLRPVRTKPPVFPP